MRVVRLIMHGADEGMHSKRTFVASSFHGSVRSKTISPRAAQLPANVSRATCTNPTAGKRTRPVTMWSRTAS